MLYFCIVLKNVIAKYYKWGLSVLFGIGVFMFWYLAFPHALSYQEQYQLFLWTGDYFCERISVPGGNMPTWFDVVYLTNDKMTLVYPDGGSQGAWAEASFWHFKAK